MLLPRKWKLCPVLTSPADGLWERPAWIPMTLNSMLLQCSSLAGMFSF